MKLSSMKMSTITITFGDVAENSPNMEGIGVKSKRGFSKFEMDAAEIKLKDMGFKCERIDLSKELENVTVDRKLTEASGVDNASILIIRNGVDQLLNMENGADLLLKEHKSLDWDKKQLLDRVVKNSRGRFNLCYSSFEREPDYEQGKGRVILFESVPLLNQIRGLLPSFMGDAAENLNAEGNYYYDIERTGIPFHGDRERRKVIAVRLGSSFPLHYQWFYKHECIGKRMTFQLNHGDIYVMSEKSVGTEYRETGSDRVLTLRHAAGKPTFLDPKPKKKIVEDNFKQKTIFALMSKSTIERSKKRSRGKEEI